MLLKCEAHTRSEVRRVVAGVEPIGVCLMVKLKLSRRSDGQLLVRSRTGCRRSLGREPPSNGHVSICDWRGTKIIISTEAP
jgi:hypothetical protein